MKSKDLWSVKLRFTVFVQHPIKDISESHWTGASELLIADGAENAIEIVKGHYGKRGGARIQILSVSHEGKLTIDSSLEEQEND